MTGGFIFLYQPTDLEHKLNHTYVQTFEMKDAHVTLLKETLETYVKWTNNELATRLLQQFETELEHFKLITASDFYELTL